MIMFYGERPVKVIEHLGNGMSKVTTPGCDQIITYVPTKELVSFEDHYFGQLKNFKQQRFRNVFLEQVSMNHNSEFVLKLVKRCLRENVNLDGCWFTVKCALHDCMRKRGLPDIEQVFGMAEQQLVGGVELFA